MTTTHYKSRDRIIEVVTSTDDARFPRHKAPMTIIKMRPQPYSRCRYQWGGITLMLTFDELRAIAQAIKSCDPDFEFNMSARSKNKPEERKRFYQINNVTRVRAKRVYAQR
jgi:hypothetical protein